MQTEAKLESLGLVHPEPSRVLPGVQISFTYVRVRSDRAYVSGHGRRSLDGSVAGQFGNVEVDVSPEQAYQAARGAGTRTLEASRKALVPVASWLTGH